MQAEFEAPMWHVMALMVEFDLTSTWNTHMQVRWLSHEGRILLPVELSSCGPFNASQACKSVLSSVRCHLSSSCCAITFLACYPWLANKTFNLHARLQDTVILHSELPLLTCIYGGLWTPLLLFDTVAKAEAFDIGLVRSSPCV